MDVAQEPAPGGSHAAAFDDVEDTSPPLRDTGARLDWLAVAGRWSRWLLVAAFVTVALVVVHDSVRTTDHAPYLAVDDGLANVSVLLSRTGQYGFPANPLQAPTGTLRLDAIVNYGPATFLIGAALDWLFGTSYAVQRSIHPVCLLLACVVAMVALRRRSLAAGGLFAWLLLELYWIAHWPMFRPDVVVALTGAITIGLLGRAARTSRPLDWALAGFAASTAASTHMIAWAVAPAALAVLLLARLTGVGGEDDGDGRPPRLLPAFVGLLVGGVLGGIAFLAALRFRVGELYEFLTSYKDIAVGTDLGYGAAVVEHWTYAFSQVEAGTLLTWAAAPVAAIALGAIGWKWLPVRRAVGTLVLPPLVVGGFYLASLGLYKNFHTGYALLIQTAGVWLVAASIAAAIASAHSARPRAGRVVELAARAGVAYLLVAAAIAHLSTPGPWARKVDAYVSVTSYLDEVLGLVPPEATVWGDTVFGLETGAGRNVVFLGAGMVMAEAHDPAHRAELAPDYVVVNLVLQDIAIQFLRSRTFDPAEDKRGLILDRESSQLLAGTTNVFEALQELLPDVRYRARALVDAEPYRTTRVYGLERGAETAPIDAGPTDRDALPIVAVRDGMNRHWRRSVGAPLVVVFEPTDPATFEIDVYGGVDARATRTVRGDVPAGIYLVSARVAPVGGEEASNDAAGSGMLFATDTAAFAAPGGGLGLPMALAPYFRHEGVVHAIVRHAGGPMFVSQVDVNPDAVIDDIRVRPVTGLEARSHELALPPLAEWTLTAEGGAVAAVEGDAAGAVEVTGDASGFRYQIVSPAVPVPPHATLELAQPLEILSGRVAVGLLSADQSYWLALPSRAPVLGASSAENDRVFIVVANDNAEPVEEAVRFRLRPGTLHTRGERDYVRRLAAPYVAPRDR